MSDAAEQLLNLSQKELDKLPADVRDKIEAVRKQVLAAQRLRTLKTAREDLLDFVQMSMPDPRHPGDSTKSRYKVHKIHEFLARKLEAVERGETLRLCISVQPRVGKSQLVSKAFPAWMIGRDPYKQIILAGYGDEFVKEFGRDVRNMMLTPFYTQVFPEAELNRNAKAANRQQTKAGGILTFAGLGGQLTGKGADCVLPYCTVLTRRGLVPIESVRVGDLVYGYDHKTERATWTAVHAVSAKRTEKRLVSLGGLHCTEDHRVYSPGSGYVEAAKAGRLPCLSWDDKGPSTGASDTQGGAVPTVPVGDVRPLRGEHESQGSRQPDTTAPAVSQAVSHVHGTCAADIAGVLHGAGEYVVDIQTETENFFCEGVLVHNCLIIDDPIKNAEEARSKATKDKLWEGFTRDAMSRLMGKAGAVVITATRWAEDDLIGRLTDPELGYTTEEDAATWEVINIPAFAEEDDPLGREVGEVLWEERTPRTFLESFRRLDPAGFAALYMGRPAPPEGNFFKREHLRSYRPHELPENLRYYAASDHAISTEQGRDSTVLGVVGVDERDNIYLMPDVVWAKLEANDQVEAMLELMRRYPIQNWWAEKGHISKSIGPFLRKRMQETNTYCAITERTPVKDKQTRAQAIQARMAMGKVFLPVTAPWYNDAVEQMLNFPNGAHDDFVDFIAWIGLGLASQVRADAIVPREAPEPKSGTLDWILKSSERIRARNSATERTARYLH